MRGAGLLPPALQGKFSQQAWANISQSLQSDKTTTAKAKLLNDHHPAEESEVICRAQRLRAELYQPTRAVKGIRVHKGGPQEKKEQKVEATWLKQPRLSGDKAVVARPPAP